MSNVGFATLTIIPSAKGFAQALGGDVNPLMGNAGKTGGKQFASGLGGTLKGLVGPAMAAAGVAGAGAFFGSVISEASGLKESLNALNVVYGEHGAAIKDLGTQAAKTVGLSNLEFNNMAVQFSAAAKGIAGPGGDVVGTLESITTRAADFASVMNLDVAEAATLFQSGLAGETEPLRRFGIDLSAATVESWAYANGIAETGTQLTAAQKQQAAYGSLMEQTSLTQGDFANTSGELANQQRILGASWDDVKAKLGQGFLPVVALGVTALNGMMPALEGLANGIAAAGPGMEAGIGKIGDVFGAVRSAFNGEPPTAALGKWATPVAAFGADLRKTFDKIAESFAPFVPQIMGAFSTLGPALAGVLPLFNPLSLVFQALLPVLPQVAALVGQLAASVGGALAAVLPTAVSLVGALVSVLSGVFVAIMPTVVELVGMLSTGLAAIIPVVTGILGVLVPLVTSLVSSLMPIVLQLIGSVLPPVVTLFGLIVTAIAPLVTMIGELLMPIIAALMPLVVTVFQVITDVISSAMQIVNGIIQVVTGLISGNWEMVWAGVGNIIAGVWNTIVSLVTGALSLLGSIISTGLALVSSIVSTVFGWIGTFVSGIWNGIVNGVSGMVGNVISWFTGLPGQIGTALAGAGTWLLQTGKNIVQGLIDGIADMGGKIGDAILGPINDAVDGVKNFLGIKSPSRLFMSIGAYTAEGMALGIEKGAPKIDKAAQRLIPTVSSFATPDLDAGAIEAGAGVSTGSPLIGSLTLQSSGNVREDLEETLFHVRRIARGGLYA